MAERYDTHWSTRVGADGLADKDARDVVPTMRREEGELAEQAAGTLAISEGFRLGRTGLSAVGEPEFEEWAEVGERLKLLGRAVNFWLGDWVNYGEAQYGEKYAQALEATDLEYQTLRNVAYVCGRVEASRRVASLSWSHHVEVAPLESGEQSEALATAVQEGWTVRELRRAVTAVRVQQGLPAPKGARYSEALEVFERHSLPTPELPQDRCVVPVAKRLAQLEGRQVPEDCVAVPARFLRWVIWQCAGGQDFCERTGCLYEENGVCQEARKVAEMEKGDAVR